MLADPFRLLVESVRDYAIFLLDPTGHVTTWNAGAERLKGWRADEIVGRHFSVFYSREEVASGKCDRELDEAAREGRVEDEGWRVRKDGSRFWANVVITALRDESGELVGFAKVTRDLTERRRAEDERVRLAQAEEAARLRDGILAREREARWAVEEARSSLEATLQSIGDAVIATDAEGKVTMMNPVAERLTGWPLADARARPLRAVFHIVNEATRRLVESPVDRVLREGVVVGLANHTLLVSRDGDEIPIHDSGAPIRDDSGAVRGVVLVFRDASREARETARHAFLAEATAVLGSSLDYRDTRARVAAVVVPRVAAGCTGHRLEDEAPAPTRVGVAHVDPLKAPLLHELGQRYHPRAGDDSPVMNVYRTGRSEHVPVITDAMLAARAKDHEHLRLLRELRPSSALVVPLAVGRRVLGTVTLAFSDSGRRFDADDIAFIEEVARRAGMAVENARLFAVEQRARDLADSASRMKDEFLASVSHELRTPLSAILGWAKLLSRPETDEARRARGVDTIERNARAMAQLVEDLLDVSRIVSGKMRLEVGRVDVVAAIRDAVESIRPAADAKQIRIDEALATDVGALQADAARLRQIVWNLLSNAVKFTPRGGRVGVRLQRRGPDAEIVVADSGAGIDPRFLPHVFEPFRQGDATVKRSSGGLGLGLTIVKHLVELHGGSVEAQSEGRDRGTTFVVRIPLPGAASTSPRDRAPGDGPDGALPLPRLGGLRVLVVEDDPDTRDVIGEVLASCGARPTLVSSVAEAMEAITRDVPDVLVSDIGMPGETGLDLIRRVRALPAAAGGRVPAAALTAYTRQEDRRTALAAGFELHIPKPIDPAELCALVATLSRFGAAASA